jgi:hypothetical protein
MGGKALASLLAGVVVLSSVSCAGYQKEQIHQKYAGSTVADKKIVTKTRQEPIRMVYYVMPNGQVICEGEYGEIRVECAIRKTQIENKYKVKVQEIVRDSGRMRTVQYDEYYLVLKSPDGMQTTQQVNDVQFRESMIGERLGLKSTDPTARRAALTTEINAAEQELQTVAAQREAKEAEKERADRTLAAAQKPGKGGKKAKPADGQAEAEAARLGRELDTLTMDEEDKRLRLRQLQQERDSLDRPKQTTPTPAPQPAAAGPVSAPSQ